MSNKKQPFLKKEHHPTVDNVDFIFLRKNCKNLNCPMKIGTYLGEQKTRCCSPVSKGEKSSTKSGYSKEENETSKEKYNTRNQRTTHIKTDSEFTYNRKRHLREERELGCSLESFLSKSDSTKTINKTTKPKTTEIANRKQTNPGKKLEIPSNNLQKRVTIGESSFDKPPKSPRTNSPKETNKTRRIISCISDKSSKSSLCRRSTNDQREGKERSPQTDEKRVTSTLTTDQKSSFNQVEAKCHSRSPKRVSSPDGKEFKFHKYPVVKGSFNIGYGRRTPRRITCPASDNKASKRSSINPKRANEEKISSKMSYKKSSPCQTPTCQIRSLRISKKNTEEQNKIDKKLLDRDSIKSGKLEQILMGKQKAKQKQKPQRKSVENNQNNQQKRKEIAQKRISKSPESIPPRKKQPLNKKTPEQHKLKLSLSCIGCEKLKPSNKSSKNPFGKKPQDKVPLHKAPAKEKKPEIISNKSSKNSGKQSLKDKQEEKKPVAKPKDPIQEIIEIIEEAKEFSCQRKHDEEMKTLGTRKENIRNSLSDDKARKICLEKCGGYGQTIKLGVEANDKSSFKLEEQKNKDECVKATCNENTPGINEEMYKKTSQIGGKNVDEKVDSQSFRGLEEQERNNCTKMACLGRDSRRNEEEYRKSSSQSKEKHQDEKIDKRSSWGSRQSEEDDDDDVGEEETLVDIEFGKEFRSIRDSIYYTKYKTLKQESRLAAAGSKNTFSETTIEKTGIKTSEQQGREKCNTVKKPKHEKDILKKLTSSTEFLETETFSIKKKEENDKNQTNSTSSTASTSKKPNQNKDSSKD